MLVEFSDFFFVFWEKVAEFGHPGSTGKVGILEDFFDFLRILQKNYGIFKLLRMLTENIEFSGFIRNIRFFLQRLDPVLTTRSTFYQAQSYGFNYGNQYTKSVISVLLKYRIAFHYLVKYSKYVRN
jgi:hypothetical protein